MPEKAKIWVKIAENPSELGFGEGNLAAVQAGERRICVARFGGNLFGITDRCPHAGGNLAEGKVDGTGNIVCPVHGHRYNIRNGFNTSGEGFHLKHWKIEIREDGVFVLMD